MIFTLDDFKHIFRAFFTATFQPDFYDLCNTGPEKCILRTPTDGFAKQNGRDAERAD